MAHPSGMEATARRFELTLPPGSLLNIRIQVRNMMCVVHQVNNSDKDFPLYERHYCICEQYSNGQVGRRH